MEEKKRGRFNIVDIVILVLILAVAAVFVARYAVRPGSVAANPTTYPFVMILESLELPDDRFEQNKIAIGDTLIDKLTGAKLGTITEIETRPSKSYGVNSDGQLVLTPRPLYSHLVITIEGKGFRPEDGGIMIDGVRFYNNKDHEINIRDSAFYLRIYHFTLEGQ